VKRFAQENGLCVNQLYQLVNGRKFIYRGWMTEQTHQLAQGTIAGNFF